MVGGLARGDVLLIMNLALVHLYKFFFQVIRNIHLRGYSEFLVLYFVMKSILSFSFFFFFFLFMLCEYVKGFLDYALL